MGVIVSDRYPSVKLPALPIPQAENCDLRDRLSSLSQSHSQLAAELAAAHARFKSAAEMSRKADALHAEMAAQIQARVEVQDARIDQQTK